MTWGELTEKLYELYDKGLDPNLFEKEVVINCGHDQSQSGERQPLTGWLNTNETVELLA